MKIKIVIMGVIFLLAIHGISQSEVIKITSIKGEVLVRFGLDEEWKKAQVGTILDDVDTILSGENSQVILSRSDSLQFVLGSNSILDISDLRKIQDRELFLYLMTLKIDQIESGDQKTKLQMGNVSVVHGDQRKIDEDINSGLQEKDWYVFETNGAHALYSQAYYPNAIIKFHKIQERYNATRDHGKIDYYLGLSFESLGDTGRALDNYRNALNEYAENSGTVTTEAEWIADAKEAIERLSQQM